MQLVFSNIYIGLALGSRSFASSYTATHTRPWPYTPRPSPTSSEQPFILQRYGSFFAHLRAAESLADVAGEKITRVFAEYGEKRDIFSAEQRGEIAEWVASVKVVATDTALRVKSGVFEMTGARSRGAKWGWRGSGGM